MSYFFRERLGQQRKRLIFGLELSQVREGIALDANDAVGEQILAVTLSQGGGNIQR